MTDIRTPWDVVSAAVTPRETTKDDVLRVCRTLEDSALSDPPTEAVCILQDSRFVSVRTRDLWTSLAEAGTDVTVLARDLLMSLSPRVRSQGLDDGDPLVDHWAYLMRWRSGHALAMVAVDAARPADGRGLDDLERPLLVTYTEDRQVVDEAFATLSGRLAGGAH